MTKSTYLVRQATPHLDSGEEVISTVHGAYLTTINKVENSVRRCVLIATPHRMVFFAKRLVGYELESFGYQNISSFDQGGGMGRYKVSFFASGNKVEVDYIRNRKALHEFSSVVRGQMSAAHQPVPQPQPIQAAPANGSENILQSLRELGELRSSGILTDAEFEAEKQKLLGRP